MEMTINFLNDKYTVDAYEAVLDEGKTAIMIPHRELLKVLTQMQAENNVLVSEDVNLIYSTNGRYSFLYKLICERDGKRMEATSVGEADIASSLSQIGRDFIICTAYARAVDKAILQMLKILTDNDGKKVMSEEEISSDKVKTVKTEVVVKNIKESVNEMANSNAEAKPVERNVINKANTMASQVKNAMKEEQKKETVEQKPEIKEEKPVVTEYKQSAAQAEESPVIDDETSVITSSDLEDDVVDAIPENKDSEDSKKVEEKEKEDNVEDVKVETTQETKRTINDLNKAEKEELNILFKKHKDIILKIVNDEITVDEAIMETNISAEKINMLVKGVEQMQAKAGKVSSSKPDEKKEIKDVNTDITALGEYVVTKGHSKGKKMKDADKADIEWLAKKDIGEMGNKAKAFLASTAQ